MSDRQADPQMVAICDDLAANNEDLLTLVRLLDTARLDPATPTDGAPNASDDQSERRRIAASPR
jgi:hypothetical protein